MQYNVIKNKKVIDVIEFPDRVSLKKLRVGVRNFCENTLGINPPYVKLEKMRKKNAYLVMGRRSRLLFTIEERKATIIERVVDFLNTDIKDLF